MPAIVEPNINDLKRYAGLNPDGDATTLALCMDAAKEWYANAGVTMPTGGSSLYTLGVYMLAVHYFDNRGALSEAGQGANNELPFGVLSIMHQLKL